jgi:hypothetical protein
MKNTPLKLVPFALAPNDRASDLWKNLEEYFERRIATLHHENENPHVDPMVDATQTALRRGQIKAFRELLFIGRQPQSEELPPGSQ